MPAFRGERRDVLANGTYNPFENPAVPLSSVALDSVFGKLSKTESGESATEATAIGLPVYYRCVALLSTLIGGCQIKAYRIGLDGDKEEIFPRILDQGNADMLYTQYELWELVTTHLVVFGNAFVLKVRGIGPDGPGSGKVIDLRPILPSRVKVNLDKHGNKIFEVKRYLTDGSEDPRGPVIYTTFEVMHIPGLGFDGLQGFAPVSLMARTIGTAIAGDKLAAKFYANGTLLTGVINVKAPLANQTQADSIRNRWIQKSGGVGHAAEVAVLDAETSFQQLTIPPDQLQFLESRRWETTEIARWFGIPPHLVGDVEKSTSWGTGIEQQNTAFVSYTVHGWTKRIEQRITREIINTNKQHCHFDLDHLLRGDMQERYQAYSNAVVNGWMTRNQARRFEDMPAEPGADELLMPLNMQTVSQANAMTKKALETPAAPPPGQQDDDQDDNSDSDDNGDDNKDGS